MSSFRPTTASSNDLVLFRYWCKALIALPAAEIPDRMEPFLEYMNWMLGSLRRIPLRDIVAFAKDWLWALQGFGSRIFQLFRDFMASPIKDMFQKFLVPSLVAISCLIDPAVFLSRGIPFFLHTTGITLAEEKEKEESMRTTEKGKEKNTEIGDFRGLFDKVLMRALEWGGDDLCVAVIALIQSTFEETSMSTTSSSSSSAQLATRSIDGKLPNRERPDLPGIKELAIKNSRDLTKDGVKRILEICGGSLRKLKLQFSTCLDESVLDIIFLHAPNLISLTVRCYPMGYYEPEGWEGRIRARLPWLQDLDVIYNPSYDLSDNPPLHHFSHLTSLSISHFGILSLGAEFPYLRVLKLRPVERWPPYDGWRGTLKGLKGLEKLVVTAEGYPSEACYHSLRLFFNELALHCSRLKELKMIGMCMIPEWIAILTQSAGLRNSLRKLTFDRHDPYSLPDVPELPRFQLFEESVNIIPSYSLSPPPPKTNNYPIR